MKKKARRGFRGYPVATVAFYGPTDTKATKAAVGIVTKEDAEPEALEHWLGENRDVRTDPVVTREILDIATAGQVKLSSRTAAIRPLLQVKMGLFVRDEPVEYCQNALPILVNAIQIGSECALKILRFDPLIDDDSRHVDVLPQRVQGVTAQEEAIEESRLALRCQRVEIVSWSHFTRRKDILAMVAVKDQVL